MGLVFWLYDRPLDPTLRYIDDKFGKKPDSRRGQPARAQGRLQLRRNDRSVRQPVPRVAKAKLPPGKYRNITGNQALAWGLMAAARLSGKRVVPSARIRSRRPATFCTSWRGTRTSACARSRPKTKSRR